MALVEEDGTIVSGANSYLSEEESDTIADDLLIDPTEWTGLSSAQKELYLKRATMELDLKNNWVSEIKDTDQELAWPREEFEDKAGRTVADNIVPQIVKEATLFLAHYQATEGSTFSNSTGVTEESYGDTSVTYAGVEGGNTNGEADFFLKLLRSKGYSSGSAVTQTYRA